MILDSPDDPASSNPAHQQTWSSPTTPIRSNPVPVEKRASSVGAVCGNDSSYTNITDFSVTDGINPEHKQVQCKSIKEAGPARRYRQPTSRRVGSDAGQHGQGGGTPPHQSTSDRRVRTTHKTAATTTGGATDYSAQATLPQESDQLRLYRHSA